MLEIEQTQLSKRLAEELEPSLAKEDNKRNRKARNEAVERLATIRRSLVKLDARLEAEQSATVAAKAAAEEAAAKKKEKAAADAVAQEVNEITNKTWITCCDCFNNFYLTKGQLAFYEEKGFTLPVRCKDCRDAKKAARPQPLAIECCDCRGEFEFSVGAQRHFQEMGWEMPVRCKDCRDAKRAAPKPTGIKINCAKCHTDFNFSVAAQRVFQDKGWTAPVRCAPCRKEHKSETASQVSGRKSTH